MGNMLTFNFTTSPDKIATVNSELGLSGLSNIFSTNHWFCTNDENIITYFSTNETGNICHIINVKITKKLGFNIAELAGEPIIQYNDLNNSGTHPVNDFLDKTLESLKQKNVDALYLHNVKKDAYLHDFCLAKGIVMEKKQAPWIDLSHYENYEDFFNQTSKSVRKIHRRLFREFTVECQVYIDGDIKKEVVDEIIELKIRQLKQLGKSSRLFANKDELKKLKDIILTQSKDFKTFVSVLRCNGELVSGAISFVKADRYYGYIVAMDNDFSKYSPGNAHVLLNVKWSIANGLICYDFLAPADDYKFRWTKGNYTDVTDILLPLNFRGRIFGSIYLKKIRPWLKSSYLELLKLRKATG